MYLLVKFQPHIPQAFEITALQSSSSNRKINLYSKYRETKLQALTKINVTYEWSKAQTWDLHHRACHELKYGLLGKLFPLLLCITTNKVKIYEETLIASNYFDVKWTNGHNLQFLLCTAIKQRFFQFLLL